MAFYPLIIYKGVPHYMGWYQHLDSLINICKDWKFTYSKTGWNNSFLNVRLLEHFDNITKGRLVATQQYRFLILDGCEIHIHIDFIEYCISSYYCLLSSFPYNSSSSIIECWSFLSTAESLWKGGRLPNSFWKCAYQQRKFPTPVRIKTYTKENILGA